jgi:hypothetical protein
MNVVATTSSALAAGLLRFEMAGQRVTAAASPATAPAADAGAAAGTGSGALAVYDARGRVASGGTTDEMVDAVGDLLSAQSDVRVDAAVLKRAWDMQGSLLDVLA